MYNTIKKLGVTFIFLNIFLIQSLMADMMFYYSAAILPSIVSSQNQTLTANFDNVKLSEITTATIDVLTNDDIPSGANITILLEEYVDSYTGNPVSHYEGIWQIVGDTITFTPNINFSGGIVQIWYKIIDQNGQESTNWINLEYPVYIQAFHDEVSPIAIESVNMDVLANDTNGSMVTSVLFAVNGESGLEYVDRIETLDGNWSVEANLSVTFTPNTDFGGGDIWANYQIMDNAGHKSKVDMVVRYPVFVRAEHDTVNPSDIGQTTVHVLDNDTNSSSITLLLESYDQYGNPIYLTNVETAEGTWTVDGSDVVFVPNGNFAGGPVGISYQIMDDQGRVSRSWITIEFPTYVQARYDFVQMSVVEPVTVDVLANDVVGDGITHDVFLVDYANGQPDPGYVEILETSEGNWTVENNESITFTPNENFSARNVHMEYQLSDGAGHTSETGLDIEYPTDLYAEHDYVSKSTIEPVTIDVLANDINVSAVTVKLKIYNNGTQYVDFVEAFDGNWTVESKQSVTFTPNPAFGGGPVDMWYQITDQESRTSTGWIHIDYPEYVYAEWDPVHSDLIEAVSVDVLSNDRNTTSVIIELVNHNYETDVDEIGTVIITDQGEWNVGVDNTVLFTPSGDFAGGYAHMEYQITDQEGRRSRTIIEIEYPLGPTPECSIVLFNNIDDVYATIANSLSFSANENGERQFDAKLDQDAYEIDPALDTVTAVTNFLNPMFMVYYYEQTRITSTGDTFIKAEMDATEVSINEGNTTWYYDDFASGNDRGYKYVSSESAGGSYTVDANGSNILSIDGEGPVFAFKAVRIITESEINNILENAGIMLTLDGNDTAQMNFTKELMTQYDWWGSVDQNGYADLDAFISANEYNSTATQFDNNGVLRTQTWQKVIIFASNSVGQQSGTLIEIDRQTNAILNDNAGTWEIQNIDDNGNNYDVIVAETTLCGYENQIFKLDGTTVMRGQIDSEAGVIGAEFAYSESLKAKLENYFVANAPLDIDPSNPTNPEITEEMLSGGRVFYVAGEDNGNGQTLYKQITIDPSNVTFIKREIIVDSDGVIVSDQSDTSSYELDKGCIRLQGEGDVKIGLNSDPGIGDWDITIYTWDWMGTAFWLTSKPSDFPI